MGTTQDKKSIDIKGTSIDLDKAIEAWRKPLKNVFQIKEDVKGTPEKIFYDKGNKVKASIKIAKPRIFIPVFPGTNCEYDTARAFENAGGVVETLVFKNLTPNDIEESITKMVVQEMSLTVPVSL